MRKRIGVCLIGAGFVGRKHTEAYRNQRDAVLRVICEKDPVLAAQFIEEYGFERAESNWRTAVCAEDIDLVCICTPNHMHVQIAEKATGAEWKRVRVPGQTCCGKRGFCVLLL